MVRVCMLYAKKTQKPSQILSTLFDEKGCPGELPGGGRGGEQNRQFQFFFLFFSPIHYLILRPSKHTIHFPNLGAISLHQWRLKIWGTDNFFFFFFFFWGVVCGEGVEESKGARVCGFWEDIPMERDQSRETESILLFSSSFLAEIFRCSGEKL